MGEYKREVVELLWDHQNEYQGVLSREGRLTIFQSITPHLLLTLWVPQHEYMSNVMLSNALNRSKKR